MDSLLIRSSAAGRPVPGEWCGRVIFKTPPERVGYTLSHTPSSGTSLPANLGPATDHYRSTRWSRIKTSDGIPVAVTCRVLGFSKQGYYRWRASPVSERDWADAHLVNAALDIHATTRHSGTGLSPMNFR